MVLHCIGDWFGAMAVPAQPPSHIMSLSYEMESYPCEVRRAYIHVNFGHIICLAGRNHLELLIDKMRIGKFCCRPIG